MLAIFDLFDEWFHRQDLKAAPSSTSCWRWARRTGRKRSVRHLENIRAVVRRLAEEAGFRDPSFARSWHILMKGSIVQAVEGDLDAAARAKSMARLLIDEHR